jgi:starch phosphorylase
MKAALNGSLNLSILDGWWAEFHEDGTGWAIPSADAAGDAAERDALEAAAMYDLIEHQIAPRFYDRGDDGVPARWVQSIRHTLSTLSPQLSADRMVREYVERLYLPAADAERRMLADSAAGARELAAWKARVIAAWPRVSVPYVESGGVDTVPQVGDTLQVRAHVNLDGLSADDVSVQVVHGRARDGDELVDPQYTELTAMPASPGTPESAGGALQFGGTVTLARAGNFGYNVRVVPRHPLLASSAELGLIAVAH